MMTNMCLIFFMFISDKYISRVFMHKRKIYLWVLDHCRWSAALTVLSQSWCELIPLWSLVSFNVVVVLYCSGVDAVMSYFFVVDYVRSWVFWSGFCYVFSFMLLTFVFVLFRGDEDGWWLCSTYVIWSENLESNFFFNWRSRFFSSSIVMLDAYLHSTWLVLSWCYSKWLGA